MKILQLEGSFSKDTPTIQKTKCALGDVTHFYYRKSYGFPAEPSYFWPWEILSAHYNNGDPHLARVYKEIETLTKTHDILVHGVGDMMHPEFMKKLSKKNGGSIHTLYMVDGEPDSSPVLSHPVVGAYDFATTCSTYYDGKTTCPEALVRAGCPGADWVAVGTKYGKNHSTWNTPIDKERPIDVVFLGGDLKICKLSMPYPPNKYIFLYYIMAMLPEVNFCVIPWENINQAAEVYANSKMGLVLHGPSPYGIGSSQRTWDLAASGVMVLSDGIEFDIDRVFKVGKEIDAYSFRDPQMAINKIKYWLANPLERMELAKNARARTRNEYRNDADDNYYIRAINKAVKFWTKQGTWNTRR